MLAARINKLNIFNEPNPIFKKMLPNTAPHNMAAKRNDI